jgi:glucose/arabinose dehydrogenase
MKHAGKQSVEPKLAAANAAFRVRHYLLFLCALGVGFLACYLYLAATVMPGQEAPISTAPIQVNSKAPTLTPAIVLNGLDHPWDVVFLSNQTMLVTERSGSVSRVQNGQKTELFKPNDVVARGEGGMLGLAVDPEFASNQFIYTCFNSNVAGLDIRVVRWQLKPDGSGLVKRDRDIVTGLPANPTGRHSGCRLGFGPDNHLWIGTGDAANASTPQDLRSLGGKILRVDRDGQAVSGNDSPNGADRRVFSWGHRNTQGLALYDKVTNGSYGISAEHGSYRDDEINPLKRGNFGWAPSAGYAETEPMTDTDRFPDAVKSIWSSGVRTVAISGATFLSGEQWGAWQGRLAVAVLKDKHLMILEIKTDGTVGETQKLLTDQFGRLRAVRLGPDGALYVTTDNGSDDKIIKLTAS